jgi:GNAT superfamily N-acetyltransferase
MMVSAENDPRRSGTIWMLDLDEPARLIAPLLPAIFCRVGPESAADLVTAAGQDISAEILKRFENGRRCYAARVEGQLAAYAWVSHDEEFIGELSLRIRLVPGEAYIWDCATVPKFRRQGLYSALLAYIIGELRADGLCRVWIGANLDNIASQRGIANAGFQHVADLVISRVLALRLVWVQAQPGIPDPIIAEARRAFLDDRDKVWLRAVSPVAPR